jgi:predicted dinucleotide-binding enzyme
MKLGIIGAGRMGGTLGQLWAARGHEIMFGVRNPQDKKIQNLLDTTGAKAGQVQDALAFADHILLAVPWSAAQDVIHEGGSWKGKVLIDCTNPGRGIQLRQGEHSVSGAEVIAQWASEASVIKAFNTLGSPVLSNLQFGNQSANTFICGENKQDKSLVTNLGEMIGFEVIDVGPLANAALLESLAMLWAQLAYAQGFGPNIAFNLLQR